MYGNNIPPDGPAQYVARKSYYRGGVKSGAAMGLEKKQQFITQSIDKKEASIGISSAIRDASDLTTALVKIGELKLTDYWKKHEELYRQFLLFYANAMENDRDLYEQFKSQSRSEEAEVPD